MNCEAMKKILDAAPDGATHWHRFQKIYYKAGHQFQEGKGWVPVHLSPASASHLVNLKALGREMLMREVLEMISEEPHPDADRHLLVKGYGVVARNTLKSVDALDKFEDWML